MVRCSLVHHECCTCTVLVMFNQKQSVSADLETIHQHHRQHHGHSCAQRYEPQEVEVGDDVQKLRYFKHKKNAQLRRNEACKWHVCGRSIGKNSFFQPQRQLCCASTASGRAVVVIFPFKTADLQIPWSITVAFDLVSPAFVAPNCGEHRDSDYTRVVNLNLQCWG